MQVAFDTVQLNYLRDFFEGLSATDQRKVFQQAFTRASKIIVVDAKSGVPVRRGNLLRSIGSINLSQEVAILIGARKGGGYKGWHGHLIENGTASRIRKTKNNAPTGRIVGVHFLEKAYDKNEDYMLSQVESEWLHAIDKMITRVNNRKK